MKNHVMIFLMLHVSVNSAFTQVPPNTNDMVFVEELPLHPGISEERAFPLKRFGRSGNNPFTINFLGSNWSDELKNAVLEASQIWSDAIDLEGPIEIRARMDNNISGLAVTYSALRLIELDDGSEMAVSGALANHLAGKDINVGPEMSIYFKAGVNWYTDVNTNALSGSGKVDLISAALHEICHGLGFFGSASVSGKLGYYSDNDLYAYDYFVTDADGIPLTSYSSGTEELAQILQSEVLISTPILGVERLFTPSTWSSGSSYCHFHSAGFMDPGLQSEAVKRDVSRALPLLSDLGYGSLNSLLPVQLISFDVTEQENQVEIQWLVQDEYQIQFYEVEKSSNYVDWTVIERVHSAEVGIKQHTYTAHDVLPVFQDVYYRLSIHELDGAIDYSEVKTISKQKEATNWSVYPTIVRDHRIMITSPERTNFLLINSDGSIVKETEVEDIQSVLLEDLPAGWYTVIPNSGDGKLIFITP